MSEKNKFDVIIIGGSYSGLSAALSLGRALRKVLVIDSGKPSNSVVEHSHNLLTHDGAKPKDITDLARQQLLAYENIIFHNGFAETGIQTRNGFEITTTDGAIFTARKIIFATGLKDRLPNIEGFAACWGTSVLHCPYCHGYEYQGVATAIVGNGDAAFHYAQLIRNWTNKLTIFTNAAPEFTEVQWDKFQKYGIKVVSTEIARLDHEKGHVKNIVLNGGSKMKVEAIYSRPETQQHSEIPFTLGCELNEQGLLKVDAFQRTTVPGVYACGDNSNFARSLAVSVSSGSAAGAFLNNDLCAEDFA